VINDSKLVALLISRIKEQQAEIAESAMVRPESDPFRTGLIAGRHQGMQFALDALDSILRDDDSKEKRS
jgi:hypothetical protein